MSDQAVCKEFSVHPKRKLCKNCWKSREQHPVFEEDAENVKKYLKILNDQPEARANVIYAWTPADCPVDRIDEYFKKFPEDMVPRHKSVGQQKRLERLIFQVPLTDVSEENCRFTDPESKSDQESFIKRLQDTALRVGIVKELSQGMPAQCPRCLLILEAGELVVMSGDEGGPAYHPACFVCFQCRDFLADLIHCAEIDGTIFCVRHYCDSSKKRCHVCDELIFSSRYALAGEKFYHRDHLLCFSCDNLLDSNKGYEKDGELYCAQCYDEKFSKDCTKCQKKITMESRHISYKENNWHYDCFTCDKCGALLSDNPFEIVDEAFYCTDCYNKDFAPRCEGCQMVFETNAKVVNYEDKIFHVACFKCADCGDVIGTGPFVPHKGRVYCKDCHLRNFGVRCFRCKYAITDDRGIMYNKQPYHEDCFTCYKCSTKISSRPFKTVGECWYCMNCYADTFCKKCHACEEPILLGSDHDILYSYNDYRWHAGCFNCSVCKKSLAETPFMMRDKVLVCKPCLQQHSEKSAGAASDSTEKAAEQDQTEKDNLEISS